MNRWAILFRNPVTVAIGAVLALFLLVNTVKIVGETRQGVVLRFGEPVRIINKYHNGEVFGQTGAGLVAVIPFFEQVIWIDKLVRNVEMERQQVLSTDQLRLSIDAFAQYRIVDPLRMYKTAGTIDNVSSALQPILGSALRNELGKREAALLLSPERGAVMNNIRIGLNRIAAQYGAQIIDVRIKKANLPEGTPLESAYERMRTARSQEALTIQAKGQRDATIIRADADAQASGLYATAFNKDPQFYDFYRAMQSYRRTFVNTPNGPQSSIILSPSNDYLREFRGGK
jgi:modulator of FtsH protease HflC